MNVVRALLLGLGTFLLFDGVTRRRTAARSRRPGCLTTWLQRGGLGSVRPRHLIAGSAAAAVVAAVVTFALVGSAGVALVAGIAGLATPALAVRRGSRRQRAEQRAAWPDAIDLLAGAVRAGDTLPGALAVVAARGPERLRPWFAAVVRDHRVSGDLGAALERMGAAAADPVADRVVRTLVLAHRVGGRELGRLLRTLAAFLREDVATRREIAARQSWTVVAARVAAVAPWLVLVLVASRPQGAQAFDTPGGLVLILVGGAVTVVGYRAMLRVGRLAEEPRVLLAAGT